MKNVTYFMDFIEQRFSDKEKLRKIVVLNGDFSLTDTWENIFEHTKKDNTIRIFFDVYITWSRDFINLGKETPLELENIHRLWSTLCRIDKIEFKKSGIDKNTPKIGIIFEGEQN